MFALLFLYSAVEYMLLGIDSSQNYRKINYFVFVTINLFLFRAHIVLGERKSRSEMLANQKLEHEDELKYERDRGDMFKEEHRLISDKVNFYKELSESEIDWKLEQNGNTFLFKIRKNSTSVRFVSIQGFDLFDVINEAHFLAIELYPESDYSKKHSL